MSFDLYFCWEKDERIDFDALSRWAKERHHFTVNHGQLWYANEDTGVYFGFDFSPEGSGDEESSPVPHGYFDTGLSFNLNFNRPSFFGDEAMPFVEEIARRFHAYVIDPQRKKGEPEVYRKVDGNTLLTSWLENNRWAIGALREQGAAHSLHMPIPTSLYLWRYMVNKGQLTSACGEDVFVPKLVPMQHRGLVELGTAFVCSQGVPTLVPNSDYVAVAREKRSTLRRKKQFEVGILHRRTFEELAADYIEEFDGDPMVRIIKPDAASRLADILKTMDLPRNRSEYEQVPLDGFVDIDLPVAAQ